jgi:hypothetical protein
MRVHIGHDGSDVPLISDVRKMYTNFGQIVHSDRYTDIVSTYRSVQPLLATWEDVVVPLKLWDISRATENVLHF